MSEIQQVELKRLRPNRLNPRLEINIEKLNELSDSISKVGILQPIIVRPMGNDFEVVVGERRYRAAQQAKLDKVPVIVRDFTDAEVLELNLVENIQREDLSVVEKAKACVQLKNKFPEKYQSWTKVSERIGVSIKTLDEWRRTLDLPDEIQKLVAPAYTYRVPKGKIDYQTAINVTTRIKQPENQVKMARKIAEKSISTKEIRKIFVEATKEPAKPIEDIITKVVEEPYDLPFRLCHMQPILNGLKTQTSRTGILDGKIKEGAIVSAAVWEPHFANLKVKSIERKQLKRFTDEDAKREGGYTLEEFKKVWKQLHGDWDENQNVYVLHFEKVT